MHTHQGTLKFFNHERGFGFLHNDAGGVDDFVHASSLQKCGINPATLEDGKSRFAYETEPARNGKTQAVDLQLLDD